MEQSRKLHQIMLDESDFDAFKYLNPKKPLNKKVIKVYQSILLVDGFKKFIVTLRKKLDIPLGGYNKPQRQDFNQFYFVHDNLHNNKLILTTINNAISKMRLREIADVFGYFTEDFLIETILEYIFFNAIVLFEFQQGSIYIIDNKDEIPPEIQIYLPINSTKQQAKEFIENNWYKIEKELGSYLPKQTKNRGRDNFFRDVQIYNKYVKFQSEGVKNPDLKIEKLLKGQQEHIEDGRVRSIVDEMNKRIDIANHSG